MLTYKFQGMTLQKTEVTELEINTAHVNLLFQIKQGNFIVDSNTSEQLMEILYELSSFDLIDDAYEFSSGPVKLTELGKEACERITSHVVTQVQQRNNI